MKKHSTTVYLGHPIDDPNERHFLERLCADLDARGTPALVLANFVAGKQFRQIDYLVVRHDHVVHVELKVYRLPMVGRTNGPWRQLYPDGTERDLGEGNPFRQAQDGTYAISDDMVALARRDSAIPAHRSGSYFKGIDTVLCLYPAIPADSRIDQHPYVSVVGYSELLQRLAQPGPTLPWSPEEWAAFVRHKSLYRPDERSADERVRDQARHLVADYRRAFVEVQAADLPGLVPVALRIGGAAAVHTEVDALALEHRFIVLVGGSGAGKTHLARHAARALATSGHLPIWVRCAEYSAGGLDVLLRRAVAPCVTSTPIELIDAVLATGGIPVVICDGVNECPPKLRRELLEEITALAQTDRVHVVLTAQENPALPALLSPVTAEVQPPDLPERAAIVASYGGGADLDLFDSFATPFELSVAAACASSLRRGLTLAELLDAYVGQSTDEVTRAGLRLLGRAMDAEARTSLPLGAAVQILRRSGLAEPERLVSQVAGSSLLDIDAGRVAFHHEQLARFFAAEDLVAHAPDGATLGAWLNDARHVDLRRYALPLEHDPERLGDAVRLLDDDALFASGLIGGLGLRAQTVLTVEADALLNEAIQTTDPAHVRWDPSRFLQGGWRCDHSRSRFQGALLAAVGRILPEGCFVDSVVRLLDRTDDLMAVTASALRAEGERASISRVVSASFAMGRVGHDSDDLAAPCILGAMDRLGPLHRHGTNSKSGRVFTAMYETAQPNSWTRLYAALMLVDPGYMPNLAQLPSLLRAAWEAQGYHLRVQAMETARWLAHVLPDEARTAVAAVLAELSTDSIMLSTALVEALGEYDAIAPLNNLEQLRAALECILQASDSADAWSAARSFVVNQLEESVMGPYFEAVQELERDDRAKLSLMALRAIASEEGRGGSLTNHFALSEFLAHGDADDPVARETLTSIASYLVFDDPFEQDLLACHLEAVQACGRFRDAVPDLTGTADDRADLPAWRDIRTLIFLVARGDSGSDEVARAWARVHHDHPGEALGVLFQVNSASWMQSDRHATAHACLLRAFPDEIRALLEWCLRNRDQVPAIRARSSLDLALYVVRTLGLVGDGASAGLLRNYVADPELGVGAVHAVRAIELAGTELAPR